MQWRLVVLDLTNIKQVYKLLKDYVEVDIIDYKAFGDSKDANDLGYEKLKNVKHIPVKESIKI